MSSRGLLALWVALLIVGGAWLTATLKPQSDLSLFLPRGESDTQQFLLNELRQGQASRLLLMGISGGDAEGRAEVSQRLVAALREGDALERIENGAPGKIALDPQLWSHRYLLTPAERLQQELSVSGLRQALEARLAELQSPLPNPFQTLIPRDPVSAYADLLQQGPAGRQIRRNAGVWSSQDGKLAILLATLRRGGLALEGQDQAVNQIHERFAQLNPEGRYRLILSGPGAYAVLSKQLIETESRQLSLLASGAIVLLLLLAYRHLPYLLYAALPLLSALLAATLLTQQLFNGLHGITLAFGITLLGVTLDYPVHLFSHLKRSETAAETMKRLWPTLRLGVITTCLGYLALVGTDFSGLRQLGVFTLIGLLTAALVSRYLLPRLPAACAPATPWGQRLLGRLGRRSWLPALLMGVITLASLAGLLGSQRLWDDDVGLLSPLPASLLERDRYLRQQLMAGESNQMLLLRGPHIDSLLVQCETLRPLLRQAIDQGAIGGVSLPCDILPSLPRQVENQTQIPSRETMADRLNQALEGLPFRAEAFSPFLDELAASRTLAPLNYEDLPPNSTLRQRLEPMLRANGPQWLLMAPLNQVRHPQALRTLLHQASAGVDYIDLREETSRLIGGFRQEILGQVAIGLAVMLGVLWLGLRSLRHALGILLPIGLAILSTLALQLLRGEAMNLFHLISLMLVTGIGIDFSLFFSRAAQSDAESAHTLHALTLCMLSTVSVFAILGSSEIPVLHAIGLTVALGVGLSYLATYAFWHMPRNPLREPR